MNENTIKGLEKIKEGIDLILKSCIDSLEQPTKVEEPKKSIKTAKTTKADEKPTEVVESTGDYTKEELDGMTYNDLKKLAKKLGIPAVGNRDEITEKILNADVTDTEEPDEEEEEAKPVKPKAVKKSAKKPAPVEEEEDDEEDEPEDEDEDEDEIDPVEQQVLEAVEDMEDDEIREILEDVGVSSKGKRQSLISKLIQAVKDGKIDFDDDNDEADEDDTPEETDDDSDVEDITESMTKKRKKAYLNYCKETEESFNDGEITREEIIDFINDFNGTKDKMKKVSDEELLETYLKITANLIDDDGNIVEEGAYTINDEYYCCGKPLKYDEDEEKFICEVCGEEYEGDE